MLYSRERAGLHAYLSSPLRFPAPIGEVGQNYVRNVQVVLG